MGDDYWKPTAECFSQLFSKPKMTEKLLTRPPFRYIHDIFSATMEATGFGDGLYTAEELDAKSIADKEGKILFLEKMIALVQAAAGEEIPVKSSKIVAGHEAEATNIFLQYLFKVATSGIDSAPIVAQILGGEGEEGQIDEQEEEDDGAAAEEEAARRAAEEEEQRKKDKRQAKKKEMEVEKQKQAAEQEKQEKQRKAQEEKERAQKEAQNNAKKPKGKAAPPVEKPVEKPNIIEDGIDDDDEDDQMPSSNIANIDPESKFGKKAMAQMKAQEEEDDERVSDDGGAGTGIKMGNVGRRRNKKKAAAGGAVERSEPQKKGIIANEPPKRSYGGYNEEDIEYMRKAIQSLCQSTNPLGKSIDFVTEDIDSMVKEYEYWKQDYAESQIKLEEQQRINEQTIQPLQDVQLAQLEDQIREEKAKIQNIRAQIIRNDNTITNLLQSVISSG